MHKRLVATLLVVFTLTFTKSRATPATYTVIYNVTTSVTCAIGDTLKLFVTFAGDDVASTTSGINTVLNILPTIVISTPYYIGYFVITGL